MRAREARSETGRLTQSRPAIGIKMQADAVKAVKAATAFLKRMKLLLMMEDH